MKVVQNWTSCSEIMFRRDMVTCRQPDKRRDKYRRVTPQVAPCGTPEVYNSKWNGRNWVCRKQEVQIPVQRRSTVRDRAKSVSQLKFRSSDFRFSGLVTVLNLTVKPWTFHSHSPTNICLSNSKFWPGNSFQHLSTSNLKGQKLWPFLAVCNGVAYLLFGNCSRFGLYDFLSQDPLLHFFPLQHIHLPALQVPDLGQIVLHVPPPSLLVCVSHEGILFSGVISCLEQVFLKITLELCCWEIQLLQKERRVVL